MWLIETLHREILGLGFISVMLSKLQFFGVTGVGERAARGNTTAGEDASGGKRRGS